MTCLDRVPQDASPRRVAIVGSGPGGLVVAKYLKEHGFEPVVFEQADDIGGQWNVRCPSSGVWALHGDEHQPLLDLLQRSVPAVDQKLRCFRRTKRYSPICIGTRIASVLLTIFAFARVSS